MNEAVADLAVLAVVTGAEDESEEPVLVGRGVLRVVARFTGEHVDRRNRLTDGRLATARMIGDGSNARDAHLGLIELAASLCRPIAPLCTECPLTRICHGSQADAQRLTPAFLTSVPGSVYWLRPSASATSGACCRSAATIRRNDSYSPACMAAARRARPAPSPVGRAAGTGPAHGLRRPAGAGRVGRAGAARRLPVDIIRLAAQLVDRPFNHLADLRRDRHPDLGDIDVEHGIEIGVEVEGGPRELGVLVDAADAVPAAPLHQPASAVDVEALLPVPVQRT